MHCLLEHKCFFLYNKVCHLRILYIIWITFPKIYYKSKYLIYNFFTWKYEKCSIIVSEILLNDLYMHVCVWVFAVLYLFERSILFQCLMFLQIQIWISLYTFRTETSHLSKSMITQVCTYQYPLLFKITFNLCLAKFGLHKWKDNGEKIHQWKFFFKCSDNTQVLIFLKCMSKKKYQRW